MEALITADGVEEKLINMGYHVNKELDEDLVWNGLDIPADVQLRSRFSSIKKGVEFNLHPFFFKTEYKN